MSTVGQQPTAPAGTCFLTCIAGPDRGKRAAITAAALLLGSAPDCNLLSDDPDVGPQFAELLLDGEQIRVKALAGGTIYVDGHAAPEAALRPGQQVRIGRSLWRADGATSQRGERCRRAQFHRPAGRPSRHRRRGGARARLEPAGDVLRRHPPPRR